MVYKVIEYWIKGVFGMNKIKHILVPVDGSEHSDKAVVQAINLATSLAAKISFLYVASIQKVAVDAYLLDDLLDLQNHMANDILKIAMEKVPSKIQAKTYAKKGNPGIVIAEVANGNNVDLIIMGTRGLGALQSAFLGSVSQHVVEHANCSVMLTK